MRAEKDFYATPRSAIDVLLDNYQLRDGWILEPCAGHGAICKALRNYDGWDGSLYGVEVRPEEKEPLKEYCDDVLIKDFLQTSLDDFDYPMPSAPGTIITNPPFSIAQEIIERCFEVADRDTEIIMFLRLGFLESKKRMNFWKQHGNVSLITLMERPSFTGNGTDFAAYGWYIWNKKHQFVLPCMAGGTQCQKK